MEGYVDIYSKPDFTYRGLIDQMLGELEKGKGTNTMYQVTKEFLNDLDQAFIANDVV